MNRIAPLQFIRPLLNLGKDPITGKWQVDFTDYFQRWLSALTTAINNLIGTSAVLTSGAYSDAPTGLTTTDAGTFYYVTTPFFHLIMWDGAKWQFVDGGNRQIADFVANPGDGWQICDGSVVSYLTLGATVTTTAFTVPNETAGTYHKQGAYDGVINPAVAPTFTGATTTTAVEIESSVNIAAGSDGYASIYHHTHPFTPTGNNATNADMKNLKVLRYFRR